MRVGAHESVAGGVSNAVEALVDDGGDCGQIFTHSPQVWRHSEITDEEAERFRSLSDEHGVGPWVIHSSYLVNLCTPKEGLREKSLDSMQKEVDAASRLGIEYVNVHLGAHTGAGVERGLDNAVSVLDALSVPDDVTVLVESDAGSGTKLGGEFSHLAHVVEESEQDLEVCLDTAHAFAAGYDLSTRDAVDSTIEAFDDTVGVDRLACVHLNDSKHARGTHKDEHAHIGEGEIGVEGMQRIVTHPDLREVPFVLETPTSGERGFAWNIDRVRELAAD